MKRNLLNLILDSLWVEFELIQEHVAFNFTRGTLHSDFRQLLKRHDWGLIIIAIFKLYSIIVVHVELEPTRTQQVNSHCLLLEAKSV